MNSMDINRKNFTRSRKRVETRLKFYGLTSICFSLLMLATLLISIGLNGYTALQQAYFKISIPVDTSEFTSEDGNILKNKKSVLQRSFYGAPILLEREDPRCIPSSTKSIGKVKIWLADKEQQVTQHLVDFSSVKEDFSHPVISKVIYGMKMRGNTLIKRGEELGVCKNEYKRSQSKKTL